MHIDVRSENTYQMYVDCHGNKLFKLLKKGEQHRSREKKSKKKYIQWESFSISSQLNLCISLEGILQIVQVNMRINHEVKKGGNSAALFSQTPLGLFWLNSTMTSAYQAMETVLSFLQSSFLLMQSKKKTYCFTMIDFFFVTYI